MLVLTDCAVTATHLRKLFAKKRLKRFQLLCCPDFVEGRQLIASGDFDVILADIDACRSQELGRDTLRAAFRPILGIASKTTATNKDSGDAPWPIQCVIGRDELSDILLDSLLRAALERQAIQVEQRETRARLELALRTAAMGSWTYHQDDRRVELDTRSLQILGLSTGRHYRYFDEIIEQIYPDDRATLESTLNFLPIGDQPLRCVVRLNVARVPLPVVEWEGYSFQRGENEVPSVIGVLRHSSSNPDLLEYGGRSLERLGAALPQDSKTEDEALAINGRATFQQVLNLLGESRENQTDAGPTFDFSRRPTHDNTLPDPIRDGFVGAAELLVGNLSRKHPLELTLSISDPTAINRERERELIFGVLKELVTNVAQHAQAKVCTISLDRRRKAWTLEVVDDGIGLEAKLATAAMPYNQMGLFRIRTQLASKGGHLDIVPVEPRGMLARACLPVCLVQPAG